MTKNGINLSVLGDAVQFSDSIAHSNKTRLRVLPWIACKKSSCAYWLNTGRERGSYFSHIVGLRKGAGAVHNSFSRFHNEIEIDTAQDTADTAHTFWSRHSRGHHWS